MSEDDIERRVKALYAHTEALLADDPKWQELTLAAEAEASKTPDYYLARNRRALYLETCMPPIGRFN